MTPAEFVAKWRDVDLTERSSAQTHFIDLCRLIGHLDPISADPQGQWFTFERGATKATGGEGWADVWKKGFFGWEYKSKNRDLDAAYLQLLKYQGALENPPLLVTCDTDRIVVHTHFPNRPTEIKELTLAGLVEPEQLAVLRAVFHDPERLRPDKTIQAITEEAVGNVTTIALALRARGVPPDRVARFLDRVVFCLFAEDVGLLPNKVFTRVVQNAQGDPPRFRALAADLFAQMAVGGDFGADRIEHFNGNLFDATEALEITADELRQLLLVSALDWSNIDASIFGTLFERALDPDKRSQLGAHYTSREDIETIVDPVVMTPLRREWVEVRARFDRLVEGNPNSTTWRRNARTLIRGFLDRLGAVTVLDPACGSGNFLYVTLQKLKDLEKEVIVHASAYFPFFPQVGPWQLHGIEVNAYAHELAQMTVWIGHLQWHERHGMGLEERPILRPMTNFAHKDAVLTFDGSNATEAEWPPVDFIVSNPPFLGDKFMRDRLGDAYVDALRGEYRGRVPGAADLCCYWFEKARAHIETAKCKRAGLLATQGIRGSSNRQVLIRIKESGDIFFAVSDRDWILDGANVNVSMVGFDDGSERERVLDGRRVSAINSDLTSGTDLTSAKRIAAAANIAFQGPVRVGDFDVDHDTAAGWLQLPNPHGRPNSDVLRPTLNGNDNLGRARGRWVVDFSNRPVDVAALYERPFAHVVDHVKPERIKNREASRRDQWWLHGRSGETMRAALAGRQRYIAVTQTAKYLLFQWQLAATLAEQTVIVFALDDAYSFGVLHSRIHGVWASALGTQLEDRPRYTPTTCFETFPFPAPHEGLRQVIAATAGELASLRASWLNPPEWTREEVLEFPAAIDGPWAATVTNPNAQGIGVARYVRRVPVDDTAAALLRKRTLTSLYNENPTWLVDRHAALNEMVSEAYGWPPTMTDEQILSELLALNLAI